MAILKACCIYATQERRIAPTSGSANQRKADDEHDDARSGSNVGTRESGAATGRADRATLWLRRRARNERPAPAKEPPSVEVAPMQSERLDTPWCAPPLSARRRAAEVAALAVFALLITVFVEYAVPFLVQ